MKDSESRIVADGAQRLREAKGYPESRKRMLAEVARRYEGEMKNASFWRRLWLEAQIRREVREGMKKEFPPTALHITK